MSNFDLARLIDPAKFREIVEPLWDTYVSRIPGMYFGRKPEAYWSSDSVRIEIQRSFGCGCSLDVSLRWSGFQTETAGRKGDQKTYRVMRRKVEVDLGWSSTGRTPAKALATIALYREMAEAGATLEMALNEYDWGTAEEVPAAEIDLTPLGKGLADAAKMTDAFLRAGLALPPAPPKTMTGVRPRDTRTKR